MMSQTPPALRFRIANRPAWSAWFAAVVVAAGVLPTLGGCQLGDGSGGWGDDETPLLVELTRNLAGPTPRQAAVDAFNREDPDKRRRAIALLSSADFGGEPAYLAVYRLILSDPDPTVRAACAAALGRHGTADDALLIVPLLDADEPYLRWEAAKALRKLHHEAAAPALVATLTNDDDADTRIAAAEALGQYRQAEVFDALVAALNDHDFGVAHAARTSLATLTGQDAGPDPREWRTLAQTHRDQLFAGALPYTYRDYTPPPGIFKRTLDKATFWSDENADHVKRPAGMKPQESES